MKKILVVLIVLVMVMALAVPAFADHHGNNKTFEVKVSNWAMVAPNGEKDKTPGIDYGFLPEFTTGREFGIAVSNWAMVAPNGEKDKTPGIDYGFLPNYMMHYPAE